MLKLDFYEDLRLLILQYEGRQVPGDQLQTDLEHLWDGITRYSGPPSPNRLFDLRGSSFSLTIDQLAEILTSSRTMVETMGPCRVAFLVDNDLVFGQMRQVVSLGSNDDVNRGVFREHTKALEWLGIDAAEAARLSLDATDKTTERDDD